MIPTNEMGVVTYFAQKCHEHGYRLVSIGSRYPDAVVEKDGCQYRVEFEYKAGNFKDHKHDPAGADLIICWENNYSRAPLPVLALSGWEPEERRPSKVPIIKPKVPIPPAAKRHFSRTGWRIERIKGGKYYQWRKGRGSERVCRYGGKMPTVA